MSRQHGAGPPGAHTPARPITRNGGSPAGVAARRRHATGEGAKAPPPPRLYTASYARMRERAGDASLLPVRTSVGKPRFWPEAAAFPLVKELAPWGLVRIADEEEFTRRYRARLESIGVEAIRTRFDEIHATAPGRALVLLCFEKLQAPGDWCHRRTWARWWLERTGEVIPELEPLEGALS